MCGASCEHAAWALHAGKGASAAPAEGLLCALQRGHLAWCNTPRLGAEFIHSEPAPVHLPETGGNFGSSGSDGWGFVSLG